MVALLAGSLSGASLASADQCTPACSGKQCGDDGCGGVCGVCAPHFACVAGACLFQGGCEVTALAGCGGCSCEACVCQQDPFCCSAGWDAMCVARCTTSCGGCGTLDVCGDGTCGGLESCGNCSADCGECPSQCGDIGTKGCCLGEVRFFCQGGELQIENCAAGPGKTCGWSLAASQYKCGEQGFDPSLTYARECPPAQPNDVKEEPLSPECQDVPFPGCCSGKSLWWCDWSGLHEVDCGTNPPPYDTCGWNSAKGYYDCGGVGMDPGGTYGQFCPNIDSDVTQDSTVTPTCKVGELVATQCGDVTSKGCCSDSGSLYYCQDGKALCRLPCGALPPPSNTCGWYIAGGSGYYDCGGVGPDPSGLHGKMCLNLPVEEDITSDTGSQASCPGIPTGGCCQGNTLHWCEHGFERTFSCASLSADPIFGQYVNCGTNPVTGKADCIKTADPSPPVCGTVTNPDPYTDVQQPDVAEVIPDVPANPDLGPDTAKPDGSVTDDTPGDTGGEVTPQDQSSEDNGFVIPIDEGSDTTPPAKKKEGGCAAGLTAPSAGSSLLLAAALWAALCAVRMISRKRCCVAVRLDSKRL